MTNMKNNRLTWVLSFSCVVACGSETSGPPTVSGSGGAPQGSTGGSASGSGGGTGTGIGSGAGGSTMDATGPGTGSSGATGMAGASSGSGGTAGLDGGGKGGAPGDSGTGPSGGCSEPIRNGVLPGKESFTVLTPSDMHFPFTKHWV